MTVSFFIHASEDEDKLLSEVSSKLGLPREELTTETIEGHFGNKIVSVRAHVIGERAREVSLVLMRGLSSQSRQNLLSELEKSVDEDDSLYLRIDRQSLDNGIGLSDEEPIRIKLKPRSRRGGHASMIKQYQDLIEQS